MPGSVFKIVVDGGDWGSPMTNEATVRQPRGGPGRSAQLPRATEARLAHR